MTFDEVQTILIDVLQEVHARNGYPHLKIDGSTRPLRDMTGFDSYCIVETEVDLSGRFGFDLPPKAIFFLDKGEIQDVKTVATQLHQLIITKGGLK